MSASRRHLDCRNFAPIDGVKGICHLTKATVLADDDTCASFDCRPKCRECRLYSPGEQEHIGTCGATPDLPMTYPDLVVVTCEWFDWKQS
ncbi:4-hydroxyphenylacetate decarboxylase small subunit [Candidatus Bipolaricaulota bacterium]